MSEHRTSSRTTREREWAHGGRFPLLDPADLDDQQQSLYAEITSPPRTDGPFLVVDDEGHLTGPFNAMLYSPTIGHALQRLGSALRFGGQLPPRTRELLICAVAAALDSEYEWYAHSRVALKVGITPTELDGLSHGTVPVGLPEAEKAALHLADALLRGAGVDTEVHEQALAHLGHAGIAELSVLVGYYQTLAGLLAAGAVPAPLVAPAPQAPPVQDHIHGP